MRTSVIGFSRVGEKRELKFATEKYFKGEINEVELKDIANSLKIKHWKLQESKIDFIASNDFSFYDNMLDTAVLLNAVPERYKALNLSSLDTYFAMARGHQTSSGDVKALAMKKWFNTNYHYMVCEIDSAEQIKLVGSKPFDEFIEAKCIGITTKPTIIGAFTFLQLAKIDSGVNKDLLIQNIADAYTLIIDKFDGLGAKLLAFEEPCLVKDLTVQEIEIFKELYNKILSGNKKIKILLQTYFGDVRDCYNEICALNFDAVGLDFTEGQKTLDLINKFGFPKDKTLFAGVVNGKNIWRNSYEKTTQILNELKNKGIDTVISTSCSLLHSPFTLNNENFNEDIKKYLAFGQEKLQELDDLRKITDNSGKDLLKANIKLFNDERVHSDSVVYSKVKSLTPSDFVRLPKFCEREKQQRQVFNLPIFPTTTIGSFPQTQDVKVNRAEFKKTNITKQEYDNFNRQKIAECIALQEELGLDVLVHGEFERNDMVEYFAEHLDGFIFTSYAWVQSYGTRCVKPPIIWGDVKRKEPITIEWSVYAQSLTKKMVKGMLTGPVTILNWSFPREDITNRECALQIALAIKEEVLDLEKNGIKIIQVDEAALREKLPLRKTDWQEYLDWAIPSFRLVHSTLKPQTQLHTHMCYSEFSDIIKAIEDMDADVITFEASRSDFDILDTLKQNNFQTQVGPGVYDIHSPRVPSVEEIISVINKILKSVPTTKLWINPDCGLKTRGKQETYKSLRNLVLAAKQVRYENL